MPQVILDEAGDEVVAVIVAFTPPQDQRLARLGARGLEPLRLELAVEELVAGTLIDEQRAAEALARAQQRDRVPGGPTGPIGPEVARERLLSPGHLAGRADGRKRRHAAIAVGVPQRQRQRAMAAHRVAED